MVGNLGTGEKKSKLLLTVTLCILGSRIDHRSLADDAPSLEFVINVLVP